MSQASASGQDEESSFQDSDSEQHHGFGNLDSSFLDDCSFSQSPIGFYDKEFLLKKFKTSSIKGDIINETINCLNERLTLNSTICLSETFTLNSTICLNDSDDDTIVLNDSTIELN